MKTVIKNNITGNKFEYKEPIYKKIDGIYGYLCVSGYKVYFFWSMLNESEIHFDLLDYEVKNYI